MRSAALEIQMITLIFTRRHNSLGARRYACEWDWELVARIVLANEVAEGVSLEFA